MLISKLYNKTVMSIESCQLSVQDDHKLVWPTDFDETKTTPTPKVPLSPDNLLVPVYSAETGLLDGVVCNPHGMSVDPRKRPLKFSKKLNQVCAGLNSNIRLINVYANILNDMDCVDRADRMDLFAQSACAVDDM